MGQPYDTSESQVLREGHSPGKPVLDAGGAAARQFNQGLKRAGSPIFVQKETDQWQYLLQLVWAEYPYCTMFGVNIVDGNIVSCENIQQSLTFGPAGDRNESAATFDDYWQALKELCGKIKAGSLLEVRFNQGRPVSARKNAGGRRFRRLLRKAGEA